MRIVLASIPAFALMLCAGSGFAQAQPQEVSQPGSYPATTGPGISGTEAETRIICRPFSHEGMVIWDKHNCHTLREWEIIRYRNGQAVDEVQRRALTAN
jgi:hypothetical protein